DGLEQGADGNAGAAAQILAQLGHHALEFGERDGDRNAIMRLRDARRGIAAGRPDAEADDLPWRRQPVHDREQGVEEKLSVTSRGLLDQRLVFIELAAGQIGNPRRQILSSFALSARTAPIAAAALSWNARIMCCALGSSPASKASLMPSASAFACSGSRSRRSQVHSISSEQRATRPG